ncbi:MAG: TVP38/TMEM64 family protein [Clostridium sp.]
MIFILTCTFIYLFVTPVHNFFRNIIDFIANMDIVALKEYILSFGIWAPIISFCIMLLQSIIAPIPSAMITISNAAIFGWWQGAMLSWVSSLTGATMCFVIARILGREAVYKVTNKLAIRKIDKFFDKHGKYTVLISRLLPFMSFDIISYAAGLTSMGFTSFIVATAIGQTPTIILYSYLGESLTDSSETMIFSVMGILAIGITILLFRKLYITNNNK